MIDDTDIRMALLFAPAPLPQESSARGTAIAPCLRDSVLKPTVAVVSIIEHIREGMCDAEAFHQYLAVRRIGCG